MKIAVIGAGMFGAAAAKYLAQDGQDVTLIGPGEPADKAAHEGLFGSHYDEGRITRGLDPWPFWSRVSRASIARYREIEAASGIAFFNEVGSLMAGPEGSAQILRLQSVAERDGVACDSYRGADLARAFPFFTFPDTTLALHEPRLAGHINPRALVRAQIALARKAGARVVEEEVTGLDDTEQGVTAVTPTQRLTFDRVLLATGGFSRLLTGDALPLQVFARTAALFRVEPEEAARLREMPTLIYLGPNGEDPYLLPPIRYPDGHLYLKMGGDRVDRDLPDRAALTDWFRSGGDADVAGMLEAMLMERMPELKISARDRMACVTTYTPDNIPHLTALSDRVHTVIGGGGRGAKNSDEVGRLGAMQVSGQELPDWAREAAVAAE